MYRQSMTRILATVGIPAWAIVAAAAPAAATDDNVSALQHASPAASFWRPPMPCVAVRAGVLPVGAGFCPDTSGALDWPAIDASLRDSGAITSEDTREPITVELRAPTDTSIDAATIGLDLTFDGALADQLATAEHPELILWITMITPAAATNSEHSSDATGCPATPRSADDFVPGSGHMPRC